MQFSFIFQTRCCTSGNSPMWHIVLKTHVLHYAYVSSHRPRWCYTVLHTQTCTCSSVLMHVLAGFNISKISLLLAPKSVLLLAERTCTVCQSSMEVIQCVTNRPVELPWQWSSNRQVLVWGVCTLALLFVFFRESEENLMGCSILLTWNQRQNIKNPAPINPEWAQ